MSTRRWDLSVIRSKVTEDQLRRVCQMHRTNIEVARALGITHQHLLRLCKQYGIKRPVVGRKPTHRFNEKGT